MLPLSPLSLHMMKSPGNLKDIFTMIDADFKKLSENETVWASLKMFPLDSSRKKVIQLKNKSKRPAPVWQIILQCRPENYQKQTSLLHCTSGKFQS
ncbi:hypothetical protein CEXT_528821 [Caerostris extrusa]|uniref:Uncharacterized protein n=1 Tax=Caerostris extrusa TaxID=172846 RepID=A0AAV4VZ54_CAEEX|nr:hypothetical protein CEXT_528821 [Caerostris extrusa]